MPSKLSAISGLPYRTRPPAGGAVVRSNSPPDCSLCRTLRVLSGLLKQKEKRPFGRFSFWPALQDSNLQPTESESGTLSKLS